MAKDNVIDLKNPEPFINDPIKDILGNGTFGYLLRLSKNP